MSLRVCILGSGSSGNATCIASKSTAILIDAGLSAREISKRLMEIDIDMNNLRGICLTHEHNDHIAALPVLHRKHNFPVYTNHGTRDAILNNVRYSNINWKIFTTGSGFYIDDLYLEPFSVPHDAYDPVGYVVRCENASVGVVSDMGTPTNLIRERLKSCNALVLESNYDEELLSKAQRPWFIKQRIQGRQGHLSNIHASQLVAEIASPRLHQIFLSHLSEECNRPELALNTMRHHLQASGHQHVRISETYAKRISEIWEYKEPVLDA